MVVHESIRGGVCVCAKTVMMKCSDTGDSVSVESLLDVPGLVLHSIEILEEKFFLLFMQVRFSHSIRHYSWQPRRISCDVCYRYSYGRRQQK